MSERVSRKQLATIWGVSSQAIDKHVADGRLQVGDDGLIDRVHADTVRAGLNPAHVEREEIAKSVGGQAGLRQDPKHPLVQARTLEAVYRAKQTELKFKRESGELVSKDEVKTEAFEIGRLIQQRLLANPSRLASEIATLFGLPQTELEPAVRKVLTREMRRLVEDLQKALGEIIEPGRNGETAI